MKLNLRGMIRGCARPFTAVAHVHRAHVKPAMKAIGADIVRAIVTFFLPVSFLFRLVKRLALAAWPWILWALQPLLFVLRLLWRFRRPTITVTGIAAGIAIGYGGYLLLHVQPPQEHWYNEGVLQIRRDLDNHHGWSSYTSGDLPDLEQSVLFYNRQLHAGLIDRLLYGRPNAEYASQALLKIGIIKLMTAGKDQKNVQMAKEYIERAIAINPGIPYARELLAGVGDVDRLAVEALAAQRDLEMLYEGNPQQHSKKPNKSKKQPSDKKNKSDQDSKNQKPSDQKGDPNQPNEQKGKQDKKQKNDHQAPANMNQLLQQNMQDVKNGTGNDGI